MNNKTKAKSYFRRILITGIIPAFVSGLFLSAVSLAILRRATRQVDDAYEDLLAYTARDVLDGVADSAENSLKQIRVSDLFHDQFISYCLSEEPLSVSDKKDARKQLNTVLAENSDFSAVSYAYFMQPNTLFSSNGIFENLAFYQKHYADSLKYAYYPDAAEGFSTVTVNGVPYLLYAESVSDYHAEPGGSKKAKANILIDTKKIIKKLKQKTGNEADAVRIRDQSGGIIWQSGNEPAEYAVKTIGSESQNYTYELLIPLSVHNRTFRKVVPYMVLFILLDIGLCAVLIWFFSKKTYQPVSNTVQRYVKEYRADVSEFEALNHIIAKNMEDRAAAESALGELFPLAKQRVLEKILTGKAYLNSTEYTEKERLSIIFPYSKYNVLAVSVPIANLMQKVMNQGLSMESSMLAVDGLIGEAAEGFEIKAYLYAVDNENYRILLNFDSVQVQQAFVEKMYGNMQGHLLPIVRAQLFLGAGIFVEKEKDIYISCDQAIAALNYAFVNHCNEPVMFDVIRSRLPVVFQYSFANEMLLSRAVTENNKEASRRILEEIIEDNRELTDSYALLLLRESLQTTVLRTAQTLGIQYSLKMMQSPRSLQSVFEQIDEMISGVHRCICEKAESEEKNEVKQIVAYINANLYDPGLSLVQVAEHFERSQAAISVAFRAEKGMKYIDYVNQKRIEKAVELLMSEKITLEEASQRVGYVSMSTFRRNYQRYGKNVKTDTALKT